MDKMLLSRVLSEILNGKKGFCDDRVIMKSLLFYLKFFCRAPIKSAMSKAEFPSTCPDFSAAGGIVRKPVDTLRIPQPRLARRRRANRGCIKGGCRGGCAATTPP